MDYNREKNGKRTLLIALSCCLMILIAVASSYAYYMTQLNVHEPQSVIIKTKELGIIYNDGKSIVLNNALPGQTIIKTITIQNTGNMTMSYDISFIDVVNEFSNTTDLVYSVVGDSNTPTVNPAISNATFPVAAGTILNDVNIPADGLHTYTITLTYLNRNESQNVDMGKMLSATLNVTDIKEV